ncbi:MAG: efflux RND transporter periplasmic adaptor subunit [Alphaproteobacteria bacterium]|nr:MAG: efflux RND transporter periplasmic adaptor subunit [Alphaproteobacteria bacterium]TMK01441.1 MAG: efflux RND transporter periplasmic adaptor subunit [Alphaproteobacteria bacterium]
MTRFGCAILLVLGAAAGAAGGYGYARLGAGVLASAVAPKNTAAAAERKILYYRDPSGAANYSATPRHDAGGRDYLPVYEDEEVSFEPGAKKPASTASGPRKLLYYRNPMGLPDISPVPKKDSMGMDYIPVYEGEEQDDGKTVKVSPEKIQRTGVRTEAVEARVVVRPVRAVGTVMHDDSRLTVVTMRSDGFIEDLFVNRTGQHVQAGEPLFRIYSPDIQRAQIDLLYGGGSSQDGPIQRLRNLGVPENHISAVQQSRKNLRTVDWLSPASGDVIEKRVINGQFVRAGDELYRIADHSQLWIMADVAEADLPAIKIGARAKATVRAYAAEPIEGEVTFIYPELRAETRTARVRIEVPNPDGRLKIDMYADVVFEAGASEQPVIAIPASAVIDSGTRQVVLIAKGEGRFEPRPVKLGRRGDGYVEVLDGISKGEEVVTAATFLIDAESNLRAALQAFTQPEAPK